MFVVDDDSSVLRALTRLFTAAGFKARAFASPAAFLEQHDSAAPGCLVLDVALPGLDGLQLQQALTASGCARPIVFITGRGDIPTSVRAMKGGAVDFLTKPLRDEDLLTAVRSAIEADRLAREAEVEMDALRQRLATLTPREREVLAQDDQGAPRPDHGEDGRTLACGSRSYRRAAGDSTRHGACAALILAVIASN